MDSRRVRRFYMNLAGTLNALKAATRSPEAWTEYTTLWDSPLNLEIANIEDNYEVADTDRDIDGNRTELAQLTGLVVSAIAGVDAPKRGRCWAYRNAVTNYLDVWFAAYERRYEK